MSSPNPYEPPREEASAPPSFRDSDSEVIELRRRVEELEKRLGKNWLVSPNRVLRSLAVLGYFIMGYAMIAAIIYGIVGLVMLVLYLLGFPSSIWN